MLQSLVPITTTKPIGWVGLVSAFREEVLLIWIVKLGQGSLELVSGRFQWDFSSYQGILKLLRAAATWDV